MKSAGAALTRLAATTLSIILASGWPILAGAQETPLQIQSAAAEDWPSLEITLTAFDENGQPYVGLASEDFSVSVNGGPVPISSLRTTSDPGLGVAVVLAFDVSGSMAGAPLDQAKAAGKALISQLGPDDQAAVVAFGSEVSVTIPFTSDRASLETAIDSLSTAGDTALYSGVQASAALVNESGLSRRSIIILSDGYDYGGLGSVDRAESIGVVSDSGALTFTVGLGAEIDEAYLTEVAQAGQGRFLLAPEPGDLTSAYTAAGGVLRQQYVLTLDASVLRLKTAEAVLDVEARLGDQVASASATLSLPDEALVPPVDPPRVDPAGDASAPRPGPAVEPATRSAEGNDGSWWLAPAGLGVILAAGGGTAVFAYRRRRRVHGSEPVGDLAPERLDQLSRRDVPQVGAPEVLRAVPQNGDTAWIEGPGTGRIALTGEPVTVGVTSDCDVRLDGGSTQARLRIWRRDGSYMAHNLSHPPSSVTIGGRPISWAILEDGDEIVIGSATLSFHDAGPAPA